MRARTAKPRSYTSVYIPEEASTYLRRNNPEYRGDGDASMQGTVSFATRWAYQAIRDGEISAWRSLLPDERRAVVSIAGGWLVGAEPAISGSDIAAELEDFFRCGDGLTWGWTPEAVSELLRKVGCLGRAETMGIIVWAKRFWKLPSSRNLSQYVTEEPSEQPESSSL